MGDKKTIVCFCAGHSCSARGASKIKEKVESAIASKTRNNYEISCCRCLGNCAKSPNVIVNKERISNANYYSIMKKIKSDSKPSKYAQEAAILENLIKNDILFDI